MDPSKPIRKRKSTFLPHWEQEGATYAITFRLADSLPEEAIERLLLEHRQLSRELEMTGKFEERSDWARLEKLQSSAFERLLDDCCGECLLREERVATVVRDALMHFEGERYQLVAWCIMPNHVHLVIRPTAGITLEKLMHSLKSFTANKIHRMLGKKGAFWESEYFDRLIRNDAELEYSVDYVANNPVKAGLKNWKWLYVHPDYRRP